MNSRGLRRIKLTDVSNDRKWWYRAGLNLLMRWACITSFLLIWACGGSGGGDSSTVTTAPVVAELKVVASSPTLSGEDFATLVDGNAGDGSVEADLPFVFTVAIGRRAVIREIRLTWGSEQDYATDYTIEDVGYASTVEAARRYGEIASVSNRSGMTQAIDLRQNPARASFLRIRVTKVSGTPSAVIRQIRLLVDPPDAAQQIVIENRNQIQLSATDPDNPLYIFRLPLTLAMKRLGDYIIEPYGHLSDHQKVVLFMTFLNSARIGYSSSAEPETTVLEGFGACGTWTDVLVAFSAAQGIPGRIIALYNYPPNNGHNVAELFVDGRWQVYDATYAAYYTPEPENEVNPVVLSFDQLQNGQGNSPGVSRVVKNPERLNAGGATALAYVGPEIYVQAEPKGVIGPDRPMIFPLSLDLQDKPSIGLDDFGPENQGAWILGSAFVNVSQEFTLTGLTPGQPYVFTAVYDRWGGSAGQFSEFAATGEVTYGASPEVDSYRFEIGKANPPWVIRFTAENDTVFLLLTHDYLTLFYLVAESYTLDASDGSPAASLRVSPLSRSAAVERPVYNPEFPFRLPSP
jgi:hypothetical protein